MLHNASLLIDDIEDDSVLRRGLPVTHRFISLGYKSHGYYLDKDSYSMTLKRSHGLWIWYISRNQLFWERIHDTCMTRYRNVSQIMRLNNIRDRHVFDKVREFFDENCMVRTDLILNFFTKRTFFYFSKWYIWYLKTFYWKSLVELVVGLHIYGCSRCFRVDKVRFKSGHE